MAKRESAVTRATVDSVVEKFKNLPEPPRDKAVISLREAIKELAPSIAVLREKGHSLDDIAKLLSGEGIEIASLTLKNYLQRPKKKPKSKTGVTESSSLKP